MDVRDVMTTRPLCVMRDTTLTHVAELMETEDIGAIPVVEDDVVIGMITDRDIVVRALSRGLDPRLTRVDEIATDEVVAIGLEDDLDDALETMARYQVRRLPVTDENNRLLGVVSQADVARSAKRKATGELLEDLSQPQQGPRVTGPSET
jgi:CBS domain-containing protein